LTVCEIVATLFLSTSAGEACDDRHRLQKEITRCRFDDPGQLNLEVGNPVAVNIAADDRDVVGSTGLVERLVVKLSGPAVKILRPDEPEVLVALSGRVRVDGREIDLGECRAEITDLIATHGCKVLAVDLTDVRLLPSGLLGLLASLKRTGIDVHLYNPSPDVCEVLKITCLDGLFETHALAM